ncbi:hypothetical protein KIN20_015609 [Parelaphostrongylus tenuis]|uniref:Uncharacterized protein n=1 Tax=Parelaphostrongylus tenuis TaxID=148309 RepID=A0AAD5N0V2_PARTN|nr:hypothetical protein KIN20_015609 [Parelaphostrongylus tenuis]
MILCEEDRYDSMDDVSWETLSSEEMKKCRVFVMKYNRDVFVHPSPVETVCTKVISSLAASLSPRYQIVH